MEYLKTHPEFEIEIDKNIQHKLLITVAPDGYLKRMKWKSEILYLVKTPTFLN